MRAVLQCPLEKGLDHPDPSLRAVATASIVNCNQGLVCIVGGTVCACKSIHMGPEGIRYRKKKPIFFVDAKLSQIAREFQKCKS